MSIEHLVRPDLWKALSYKPQGSDLKAALRLNCNENPWAPQNALDPLINRYPEKQPAELLNRLAELYQVLPENLLVTRGADDGIDALIRSFCQPCHDSIVQCSPAFVMYQFFARLQSIEVQDVPLVAENGFRVDFLQLKNCAAAKIFFLCNPNNPTGSLIESQAILEFSESVSEHALVVVDEAYIEFASVESLAQESARRVNLVVLRTLSKAWSLAGARLGVVIGNMNLIDYLKSTTSPYPLSRSAVAAALQTVTVGNLAAARQRIEDLKQQRELLYEPISQFHFVEKVFPSEANFLLIRIKDSAAFMKFMLERGILLRNQSSQPGLTNCVRISMGTSEHMQRLLQTMQEFEEATDE